MPTAFCHFTLIDVLGRGGMSTVYRARAQSTGQWVALKVLNRDMLDNPIARQRFDQEPTLQLLHPNIVHVLSAGICDGLPYFTMELIEGISMEQMLTNKSALRRASSILLSMKSRQRWMRHIAATSFTATSSRVIF